MYPPTLLRNNTWQNSLAHIFSFFFPFIIIIIHFFFPGHVLNSFQEARYFQRFIRVNKQSGRAVCTFLSLNLSDVIRFFQEMFPISFRLLALNFLLQKCETY